MQLSGQPRPTGHTRPPAIVAPSPHARKDGRCGRAQAFSLLTVEEDSRIICSRPCTCSVTPPRDSSTVESLGSTSDDPTRSKHTRRCESRMPGVGRRDWMGRNVGPGCQRRDAGLCRTMNSRSAGREPLGEGKQSAKIRKRRPTMQGRGRLLDLSGLSAHCRRADSRAPMSGITSPSASDGRCVPGRCQAGRRRTQPATED